MRPLRLLILIVFVACTRETQRPNVLLITLDTTRADHLGCYGGRAATPAIDALAAAGVRFEQADTVAPLTLPSHASILSGMLPLHHGLRNNGAGSFPASMQTLTTTFAQRGYRTGAFVSSFVLDHRFGLDRGFETYDDAVERGGGSTIDAERSGGVVADAALAWLTRNDERPFFAWVHFYDPHAPYAPPEPFRSRFASAPYDGEIAYVDAQIARVLERIDRTRTIIIVTGDHGEGLGDHGEMRHGLLTYESTLRVPLIIAAPSLRPQVVRTAVSTADIAPTVAALSGSEMKNVDGADLSSSLRDGHEPAVHEIYAETEYPLTFGWSSLHVLRNGEKKLIDGRFSELFDLAADRAETKNVAPEQRRALADLSRTLARFLATAVRAAPATIDAETKAKLASLGYVAPVAGTPEEDRYDPRQMRELFRDFENASAALGAGHVEDAKAIAMRLVEADPRNRVFRSTLATAYRQSGDVDRAAALYRESVALAPSDADAWYDLASVLEQKGATAEARSAIDEAVRLDARNAEAHNLRGTILAETGGANPAFEEFQKAIAIDPRNARAYTNSGNVLRDLGRLDDAATSYRRAIDLAPRDADPLNGLGTLLVQSGRAAEAVPYFDRALAIEPGMHEARLNRAIALTMTGDVTTARSELRQLLNTPQRNAARELLRRLGG
jgi:arylsulfatase A-like enzyme/Flp pilus assembly protein TadD